MLQQIPKPQKRDLGSRSWPPRTIAGSILGVDEGAVRQFLVRAGWASHEVVDDYV